LFNINWEIDIFGKAIFFLRGKVKEI